MKNEKGGNRERILITNARIKGDENNKNIDSSNDNDGNDIEDKNRIRNSSNNRSNVIK